jgi:hypothetical protein
MSALKRVVGAALDKHVQSCKNTPWRKGKSARACDSTAEPRKLVNMQFAAWGHMHNQ